MGNLKNNQRKLKQEDKNDDFKELWDGTEHLSLYVKTFLLQYGKKHNMTKTNILTVFYFIPYPGG